MECLESLIENNIKYMDGKKANNFFKFHYDEILPKIQILMSYYESQKYYHHMVSNSNGYKYIDFLDFRSHMHFL